MEPAERRRMALALLPLVALGVAVGVAAYRAFDPAIAGDHSAQVEYLEFIRQRHRLPLAEQGFAMYHPPAYYLLSAVVSYVGLSLTDAAIALVPLALLVAFVAYNVRVPSGSSGLYVLVGIIPVAVALGGLASRLAVRFDGLVYVALLGWAVAMATASGAF